ncbi:MAG TPA: acyltransferase [Candidatus Polarisedimenticolia bacterium]|nr:acyltransferase [Candidatus Polarisedimenticolia bacterium]
MDLGTVRARLPALTSLRFFAAFHVVIFHFQAMQVFLGPSWFQKLSSIGYVGVSFFFVLSGFILVYTYAGRPMILKDFWRARFARIYPAYAFSLLVTAPFFFFAVLTMNIPFFAWAKAHLKFVSVLVVSLLQAWVPPAALSWNAVAWSLSVEAFFYLLFPFLLLFFVRRSPAQLFLIAAASWLTSLALSISYVLLNPDHLSVVNSDVLGAFWLNALKFHPLARLPEFLLGMACGFLFLRSRRESKLALRLVVSGMAAFVVVVYFSALIPYPILHTALLAPAFAAIVYAFALRPKWGAILENRLLVLCGDASYSLYLLHSMIIGMYFHNMTGQLRYQTPLGVLVFVILAVTISALVYRFIEEPARRKLNPRRKPQLGRAETQPPPQPVPA